MTSETARETMIKTHIEIPITLYVDGTDINDGNIYAEIETAEIYGGEPHTLGHHDLLLLIGLSGVQSLVEELITDAQDRAELQADHERDLREDRFIINRGRE
jgi:hypothetical protein